MASTEVLDKKPGEFEKLKMDSSKKSEIEEKKQESCNATEDKGIDETVSQSVPDKGIDEMVSQSVPDKGIDEMVSQSVPDKGIYEMVSQSVSEKLIDEMVSQSVPEKLIDEMVSQSVPDKGIYEMVSQSVPEKLIDEIVSQSVPEKGIDETVSNPVPESVANEKNNTNNSADSSVETLFERKKDKESQEKAENNEKVELKEMQDLKQANEFDKFKTDSVDDDAKPYNVEMLDERKRDEISQCGESKEGKEVERQEDADKKASDKGKQELNDSQSQNSNKSHCSNQNNYCDDAPKSEVAADKVEQKDSNNGISAVTMEDSREEVQQEKMDDKEQEIEHKETDVNTRNMDLSECMSYENELNMSEVEDKQIEVEDKQIEFEDKQIEVEDKQIEFEDKQIEVEDKQSEVEDKQSEVEDKQSEVEGKQSEVEDKQSEVEDKQSEVEDKQSEDEDENCEVEDKQSKVDKTYNDQSEIVFQSAMSMKNEFHVLPSTSEEEQEKRDRDIKEEKVSKPISDFNNSIGSDENISLNLLNHDSQSMSNDTTKHSTGQANIESIVNISVKSHENSCLKLSDDTTLNIPIEDQTKIGINSSSPPDATDTSEVSIINSSSPPEAMDTSEVSITRRSETIVLPDEESSNISKPLFDKIKILKAEENSNTSTGDERSVESIALDNSCLNTPQEENSCLSFPDESSVLSFMDESSGISVPESEPNFLQYQRRQNLSLFDEAANLSAPDDKCFQRPDTPSSAVTETQDSTPAKKPRRSSISSVTQDIAGDDHSPLKAENLYEYQWPQEPDADWYMLQEHVSEFLEVKSFKRKYPDLFRRVCDKHEKDFLREKGVVTETQSDLGLTALKSDEVHDFMARDYPEKYRDYMKMLHEREKQNISNKHRDYEVPKLEKGKIKEYTKKAVKAAAEWNCQFQRERKEERRAYFDVQTFTVHYPVSRYKKIPAEATQVDPYPVALIPGQFQEYYRRYSKEELKYFPLNTSLFDPPKKMGNNLANPADADSEDPEEEGKQAGSGSESDSGDDSTSNSDDSSNSEEIPMELEPDEAQCRICKTKAEKKKKIKKKDEELVQCSECKSLGHPSCLDLTNKMIAVIKTYPWQCMECKTCVECMDPYDEDKMMFCDRCDRGYHTFCVGLKSLPTGKWECVSCKSAPSTPKATPKSTTKSNRMPPLGNPQPSAHGHTLANTFG
ncbi:hypothetical protein ACJMK2_036647 [Sinanodonta woodiana]|uniref:PHD finger protein 10 n=1 Tax=Sinanodonta woodiana TaxID=1069815 RepID=A0ABD3WL96_SINWO